MPVRPPLFLLLGEVLPAVVPHVVATRLDCAGLSAREIADYLSHQRISMT